MADTLDIQKVINTSTSSVSIDDLNKKGFKQVKVLNQAIIARLIGEAVDRVLSERSKEISKEERDKVIKEARTQFETLAKKRLEKERTRIDELERANNSLTTELETLRKRLSASVEVQATRDQAIAKMEALESEVTRFRRDFPELESNLARQKAETQRLQSDLAHRSLAVEEVPALRSTLQEYEKRVSLLEGQIEAKNEEIERSRSGFAHPATLEKLLAKVTERVGNGSKTDVSQIMLTLDGMSRRLSNIGSSGGGLSSDAGAELTTDFALNALFDKEKDGGIESNVTRVKVKENKAAGVKDALAKLKKLQQGVADGE